MKRSSTTPTIMPTNSNTNQPNVTSTPTLIASNTSNSNVQQVAKMAITKKITKTTSKKTLKATPAMIKEKLLNPPKIHTSKSSIVSPKSPSYEKMNLENI